MSTTRPKFCLRVWGDVFVRFNKSLSSIEPVYWFVVASQSIHLVALTWFNALAQLVHSVL